MLIDKAAALGGGSGKNALMNALTIPQMAGKGADNSSSNNTFKYDLGLTSRSKTF